MKKDIAIRSVDSLGIIPQFILQPHSVSRSIYTLSVTARKLTIMAMSILPADLSIRKVRFTFNEFIKAIGMEKGGNSHKIFVDAVNECVGNTIKLETAEGWKIFTWFSSAEYNKKTDEIMMVFSDTLADHLVELKKFYARFELSDLGKLSSRYAIRFYELAMSYSSLAGQMGNKYDCWYFKREIADLRILFAIEPDKYKLTKDFRINVIEKPLNEINNANIGLNITPTYIRDGKFIHAIHFDCKKVRRKTIQEELDFSSGEDEKEREINKMKFLYPEEYKQVYQEELGNAPPFLSEERKQANANYTACKRLYEVHNNKKK